VGKNNYNGSRDTTRRKKKGKVLRIFPNGRNPMPALFRSGQKACEMSERKDDMFHSLYYKKKIKRRGEKWNENLGVGACFQQVKGKRVRPGLYRKEA